MVSERGNARQMRGGGRNGLTARPDLNPGAFTLFAGGNMTVNTQIVLQFPSDRRSRRRQFGVAPRRPRRASAKARSSFLHGLLSLDPYMRGRLDDAKSYASRRSSGP